MSSLEALKQSTEKKKCILDLSNRNSMRVIQPVGRVTKKIVPESNALQKWDVKKWLKKRHANTSLDQYAKTAQEIQSD